MKILSKKKFNLYSYENKKKETKSKFKVINKKQKFRRIRIMKGGYEHCSSTLFSYFKLVTDDNNNIIITYDSHVNDEDKEKEILFEPHYCSKDEYDEIKGPTEKPTDCKICFIDLLMTDEEKEDSPIEGTEELEDEEKKEFLDEYYKVSKLYPCSHVFHISCISKWIKTNSTSNDVVTCPLCKKIITGFYVLSEEKPSTETIKQPFCYSITKKEEKKETKVKINDNTFKEFYWIPEERIFKIPNDNNQDSVKKLLSTLLYNKLYNYFYELFRTFFIKGEKTIELNFSNIDIIKENDRNGLLYLVIPEFIDYDPPYEINLEKSNILNFKKVNTKYTNAVIPFFLGNNDQKINPGDIPESIRILVIFGYNYDLEVGVIPSSVTALKIINYQHELKPGVIPSTVKILELNNYGKKIHTNSFENIKIKIKKRRYYYDYYEEYIIVKGVITINGKKLNLDDLDFFYWNQVLYQNQ